MIERRTLIAASVAAAVVPPMRCDRPDLPWGEIACHCGRTHASDDRGFAMFCDACLAPLAGTAKKHGGPVDGLYCTTKGCISNTAWIEELEEMRAGIVHPRLFYPAHAPMPWTQSMEDFYRALIA